MFTEIARFATQVSRISGLGFEAFLAGEIESANEAVDMVQIAENDARTLTDHVLSCVKKAGVAARFRTMISSLTQIAKYSGIVGEVTINRIMEKSTEICECLTAQ